MICVDCGAEFEPKASAGLSLGKFSTGSHRSCPACKRLHARAANAAKRNRDELIEAQGGVCAACGGAPTDEVMQCDIDHDGWVFRGFVHRRCNTIAGLAGDQPALLRAIASYLEAPRT